MLAAAFRVLHDNPELLEDAGKKIPADILIMAEYARYVFLNVIKKTKEKLKSADRRTEGLLELQPLSLEVFDKADFQLGKSILKIAVGELPLLKLHLIALKQVFEVCKQLKAAHNNSTITDIVLNECSDLMQHYRDIALMTETNFSEQEMLNVLS